MGNRLLDPTIDIVFKFLFVQPENKPLLHSLLTAVLEPASPIASSAQVAGSGTPSPESNTPVPCNQIPLPRNSSAQSMLS